MEILLYFLPFILIFGIVTSLEDIKFGKIRNKYTAFAIIISFLLLFILAYAGDINAGYFSEYITNLAISFILGYALWHLSLWSAADAKLFAAYAALVPLGVYKFGYVHYFPSLSLLANTFIPAGIFFLFKIFARTKRKEKISALKKTFGYKNIFGYVISVFAISWISMEFFSLLKIYNSLLSLLLVFMLYTGLKKILKNNFVKTMTIISLLRIFFQHDYVFSPQIFEFLGILAVFVTVNLFVSLSTDAFITKIHVQKIRAGMMLAEGICKKGKKYIIGNKNAAFSGILTEKDVTIIKKLHKEKKLAFRNVCIVQTIPFAPLMFLGVLLTIIFQGNIASIALQLCKL